ncbi:hypothetical protein [Chlorobium sp. N1]|uniref:hypothetical protein n=1 Tax=Chlorobium sp. N1 TaxID=2491138 RepID=UPI001039760E|nr:hypothetical protein [Chlorobium sp. N1]TCD47000.1 hypothetical protein E0L29_10205 [Chlorobium sp. N1]
MKTSPPTTGARPLLLRPLPKRLLLGLTLAVAAATLYLGASFALLLHTNHKTIEARAVNGTMADARRIESYAREVERYTAELQEALEASPFDERRFVELVYRREADSPWKVSLELCLVDSASGLRRALEHKELEPVFRRLRLTLTERARPAETPKAAPAAGWQPARWDGRKHAMTAAYLLPIAPKEEQPIGWIQAGVQMEQLTSLLNRRDMGSYGYRFIAEREGALIAHPSRELLVRGFNILRHAAAAYSAGNAAAVAAAFRNGEPTTVLEPNELSRQPSLVRFEPVARTGWMSGVTLVTGELSVSDAVLKRRSLQLLSAAVALLLLSGLTLFLFSRSGPSLSGIRRLSLLSTALLLAGLLALWTLQVARGKPSPYAEGCITTTLQVERHLEAERRQARRSGAPEPQAIETGILLRSARLDEASQTADLSGILWQRIPDGTDPALAEGLRFPDQIETRLQEEYRIREGGHTVVGRSFTTRIRQDFKTSLYPFDRLDITLRIRPPKDFSPVLFIPDLAAYKLLSPSARTLVADNFSVPGWRIDDTYFTLSRHTYGIDYGQRLADGDRYLKDLVLNVSMGRDWVGTFVSVLIPVFVILTILYSGIRMITNDAEGRKRFNFDAMRTSVIGATLTLFLIFAVKNARGEVVAEDILYVEKIYFMIYFAILANIFIAIALTEEHRFPLFAYRNGLIFRYLYWPFYIGLLYLITLTSFS